MKKVILFSTIALLIASIVYFTIQTAVRASKGDHIAVYPRFMKVDENGNHSFNWWALLSPIQGEGQNVITDTIQFGKTVIYPVAPHFDVVAPESDTAEAYVAQAIAQEIADTLKKISLDSSWDYDGQGSAVRRAAQPNTLSVEKPSVSLSLHGTASPEAVKYGFWQSIQPGVLEPENALLAQARLQRTTGLLVGDIHDLGVQQVSITDTSSEELQFSETDMPDSSTAAAMLPSMRYVRANVTIPVQRLVVTPYESPIALPIWLGLLSLGLLWLLTRERKPEEKKEEVVEYVEVERPYIPQQDEPKGCSVGFLLIPFILLFRFIWWLLRGIWRVVSWIVEQVVRGCKWYLRRPTCCQVLIISLLLNLITVVVILGLLLGWWHICI